jgi:hypothetical protein
MEKKRKKVEQYQQVVARHQKICDKVSAERDSTLETVRKLHYCVTLHNKVARNSRVNLSAEPTQEDMEAVEYGSCRISNSFICQRKPDFIGPELNA